jgi:cytoskeletal protein CcmA (bactofilin family)
MNFEETHDETQTQQPAESSSLEVSVGNAMPTAMRGDIPMLNVQAKSANPEEPNDASPTLSRIAEGLNFVSHAILRGPCSIAGNVQRNLTQAPEASVAVVVTQTGRVTGDITAQKISVMGHTNGILDSGHGEVTLHDSASVQGLVRYGRIQVNGADLNATLERVAPNTSGA